MIVICQENGIIDWIIIGETYQFAYLLFSALVMGGKFTLDIIYI